MFHRRADLTGSLAFQLDLTALLERLAAGTDFASAGQ
jgi:hypothetical protein